MASLQQIFDSAFFQLPMLEALSYIAAGLTMAAAIVGLSKRFFGFSSASSQQPMREYRTQKAA
jgi:hypothetical protein